MIFWLATALMTLLALCLVFMPLFRGQAKRIVSKGHNINVYQDQLLELDADFERGLVGPEELAAAKLEIQRRILTADRELNIRKPLTENNVLLKQWSLGRWLVSGILVFGIPAFAVSIYLTLGKPGLQAQPFAERIDQQETSELAGMDIDVAIENLEARLIKTPDDVNGWLMLGRTYMTLERFAEATRVLRKAAALTKNKTEIMTMLAESIVLAEGGAITIEAKRIFENTLAENPRDPAARYYIGLSLAQGGNTQKALDIWMDLAADTPIDAEWRKHIVEAIMRAASDLDIQISDIPSAPSSNQVTETTSTEIPGPTAEDIIASESMSEIDRRNMIKSMVDGLAEKLEKNPKDIEGWRRLIRAYRVLGENDEADRAENRLAKIEASEKSSIGVKNSSESIKSGPNSEDIKAAESMSNQDRSAMILSMVEQLAARLESNPDDLEGWLRLARSWKVLKEYKKSMKAFARAAELSPDDAMIQASLGRAIIEANQDSEVIPKDAILAFRNVLLLAPNHMEALWFVGYSEAENGNISVAKDFWSRLINLLPPGSDDYNAVKRAIESL